MKSRIKHTINIFILATLVIVCTASVYAQEEAEEAEAAAAAPLEFSEPPRLFIIPKAKTLRSLDVNLSGSATFASGEYDFSGTGLVGLGDIAQFEISTLTTLTQVEEGKDELKTTPAAGLKFHLPGEKFYKDFSGLAIAYRNTFGGEKTEQYLGKDFRIKRQLADLFVVASGGYSTDDWRGVTVHVGADFIGSKLIVNDDNEFSKNFVTPFGGLEIWATNRAKLMFECEYLSLFNEEEAAKLVNEEGPVIPDTYDIEAAVKDRKIIDKKLMMMFGVRFFFTQYVTTDVGLKYQEGDSVTDIKIDARLAVSIPTHLIYESVVSQ